MFFKRRNKREKGSTTARPERPYAGRRSAGRHPLVWLEDVVKVYSGEAGDFMALKGLSLGAMPGDFVSIVGKSGSGKSTLINMMTGIDRPTTGRVMINGFELHTMSEEEIARWRRRNLGIVFQFFQLLPTLTVLENILLPMDFSGQFSKREQVDRAMQLLSVMQVDEHANKLPSGLSGGQQQRVAIARALANDPPLIVADEPTGNLDSKTADHVFLQFERLVDRGKTVIMVTHDDELAQRGSRIIRLSDGSIIADSGRPVYG